MSALTAGALSSICSGTSTSCRSEAVGRLRWKRIRAVPAFDTSPGSALMATRVAFSSDRDGLWNIWTMARTGRTRSQVSQGEALVREQPDLGRRTATTSSRAAISSRNVRSAPVKSGCSTRAGRDGLQVTERNGFQKDAGEPAVQRMAGTCITARTSLRARRSNTTRTRTATIYAIIQPRSRPGTSAASSASGGSVTPQSSPDGKPLAFVRRVRLQSILYVRDLETGRDRVVFEHLDKDLQEAGRSTACIRSMRGCRTARRSIVWGEGKIWRVDVASWQGQRRSRSPRRPSRR